MSDYRPHVRYTVLDERGEETEVVCSSVAGERLLVEKDGAGHFTTWRLVDASGAELRRGTWRVDLLSDEEIRQHGEDLKRARKRRR